MAAEWDVTDTASPITRFGAAMYAAGSFGTGVFSTVPAVLLLYFCTETLHLSGSWAAAIVFVPKAWAILWDPFVGFWSDRTSSRFGRRRPFLIAGAIGVAVTFVMVFSPPSLGELGNLAWMMISYFLLATVYSLFAVPYVALPSEIAAEKSVRARLVSWRMFVAMLGVLAGAGLAPRLIETAGGGRAGYAHMSEVLAAICLVAMLGPLFALKNHDVAGSNSADRSNTHFLTQLSIVVRNRAFICLCVFYILELTAIGILSSAVPYLVTGALGRHEGDIGTALTAMLVATSLSMPLWSWAASKLGDTRTLAAAVVGFALSTAILGAIAFAGGTWLDALLTLVLGGIGFAGLQVLPYTLVAHLIHAANHGGDSRESSFAGVWTACEKLGLALGPALTGICLSISRGPSTQSIAWLVVVGPLVLATVALPLLATVATRRLTVSTSAP